MKKNILLMASMALLFIPNGYANSKTYNITIDGNSRDDCCTYTGKFTNLDKGGVIKKNGVAVKPKSQRFKVTAHKLGDGPYIVELPASIDSNKKGSIDIDYTFICVESDMTCKRNVTLLTRVPVECGKTPTQSYFEDISEVDAVAVIKMVQTLKPGKSVRGTAKVRVNETGKCTN